MFYLLFIIRSHGSMSNRLQQSSTSQNSTKETTDTIKKIENLSFFSSQNMSGESFLGLYFFFTFILVFFILRRV